MLFVLGSTWFPFSFHSPCSDLYMGYASSSTKFQHTEAQIHFCAALLSSVMTVCPKKLHVASFKLTLSFFLLFLISEYTTIDDKADFFLSLSSSQGFTVPELFMNSL